ncbi:MAG: AAA family ATPase [Desulfococcaceae bacterium]
MKILRLDLRAFGPFTDTTLDLSGGTEGLHLIYGPNEAGKSSALRALTVLLYDFPHKTTDNFIHTNQRLRVGGVFRKTDGSELAVMRRKARKSPLRAADDETVVEEAELSAFLGGVDAESFAALFGIDHDRLVAGGREIIRGAGRVGELLFAAGAGLGDFQQVKESMAAEAADLFKPGGSKPAINASISAFQTQKKAVRDAQLPGEAWEKHDKALKAAESEKENVVASLTRQSAERNRRTRILEALPIIARRDERREEYAPLQSAPVLPEDFEERSRTAMEALRMAESRVKASAEKRERLSEALAALTAPDGLADHADTVKDLLGEAGSIRKAARDRVNLQTQKERHETDAQELLADLRPDLDLSDAGEIRLSRTESRRIRDLAAECEKRTAARNSAREAAGKLERRLRRDREELEKAGEPIDSSALAAAVERVQKRGDVAGDLAAAEAAAGAAETEIADGLARLPFWSADLAALETAAVPSAETVERFETELREASEDVARALERVEEIHAEREAAEAELRKLSLDGEVPTEADLQSARNQRDAGWRLVRTAVETGETPKAEVDAFLQASRSNGPKSDTLTEAVETAIRGADDISDRLRREADRVARKVGLVADLERLGQTLDRAKSVATDAQNRQDALLRDWRDLWSRAPLTPGAGRPREMRSWLSDREALLAKASDGREKAERAAALRKLAAECREELTAALHGAGVSAEETDLSRLLDQARKTLGALEEKRTRRQNLQAAIREREAELDEANGQAENAESALAAWRSKWAEAVRPLGLDADATPGHAHEVMDAYAKFFEHRKEAEGLAQRLAGIDRDADAFADRVAAFVEREAPDLRETPPEVAVDELNSRLAQAQTVRTERQGLKKQLREEETALETAGQALAEVRVQVKALCGEAGCDDPAGLIPAARQSKRRTDLEAELAGLDARLHELAAGAPLPDFVASAREADPDVLAAEMAALDETIRDLETRRSELDQTIGGERAALARMDGGDHAAVLQAEAESILARMAADVEHYARLRLASAVLERAVERYRKKSQGPVLGRAKNLFARMTLGRFTDARVEAFQDGDELVGVRHGGELVRMNQMSDGTADQLFLAVRLASLESYIRHHEPLPFVVDDILVQFDDHRAKATLEVLAELSRETQVIFFTHHRHLLELAEGVTAGDVVVHELGGTG